MSERNKGPSNVIQLPTEHNLREQFKRGARVECAAVDGSVMLRVGETELWWSFEEAAETLEVLSDTVADAFAQLRKEMEEKNGR